MNKEDVILFIEIEIQAHNIGGEDYYKNPQSDINSAVIWEEACKFHNFDEDQEAHGYMLKGTITENYKYMLEKLKSL